METVKLLTVQAVESNAFTQKSANFSYKEQGGEEFWLRGPYSLGLDHSYSLYHCIAKAAIDNTETSACSCVPIKLYWWTLKSEYHVTRMHHEILVFGFFSLNKLKMEKPFLAYSLCPNREQTRFGSRA